MRRSIPTLLLVSAAIALTACGEYSTTEPLSGAKGAGLTPSFAGYAVSGDDQGDAAAAALAPVSSGTSIEIKPSGGTLNFDGYFTLTYRQGSVSLCDEGGTGCLPLTHPVHVTATFGSTWIDLSTVTDQGPVNGKHLYFAAPGARLATFAYANNWRSIVRSGQHLGLLFAPTPGSPSELNAPKSHFDAATGALWRWVTHFSGYAVSGGDNCDPSVDPTCASTPAM